jgi:hypothetical protein
MARHLRCTLVVVLLLCCFPARALDSLDWLVADSDLIIRGRVQVVWEKTDPLTGRYDYEEASIKVYETLKGSPAPGGEIKVLRCTFTHPHAEWSEGPCLFLLVEGRRATYLKSPDFLEGRYLLVDPMIRIMSLEDVPGPPEPGKENAVDWLRDVPHFPPVYGADGRRLRDAEEILLATREAVARQRGWTRRPRPAVIGMTDERLPPGTWERLYRMGYPGFLVVPADDGWEARANGELSKGQALAWINDLVPHGTYAQPLYTPDGRIREQPVDYFMNDRTVAFLFGAVDDPWGEPRVTDFLHWPRGGLERFEARRHPNREWASDVLRRWRIRAPGVKVETPLLRHYALRWIGPWTVVIVFLVALPLLVRRRGQGVIRRTVTWGLVCLAAASAMLWWRSGRTYHSVRFATAASAHEASCCWGELRYLVLSEAPTADWRPSPRGLAHGAVSLEDVAWVPHHLNYLRPETSWRRGGVGFAHGFTFPVKGTHWPPTASNAVRYHLLRVPLAWVTGVFAAGPVLGVLAAGWRRLRGRRWARRRRCRACGYDLRHAPGRCPECGAVIGGLIAVGVPATSR